MNPCPKIVHTSNKAFRRFVSKFPCAVPGCNRGTYHDEVARRLRDPHHLTAKGMGGHGTKVPEIGDTVALCRPHHSFGGECIHFLGRELFEKKFNVDLKAKAREIGEEWTKCP